MIEKIIYLVLNQILPVTIVLFVYFLKRKIDSQFQQIDKTQEQIQNILFTVNKEKHDTLIKTFSEVWGKIKEFEYSVRFEMSEKFERAQQSGEKIVEFDKSVPIQTLLFFEKRSIFFTEELNHQISCVLKDYLIKAYNGYIDILRQGINKEKTLDDVNSFIPKILGIEYRKQLSKLEKILAVQTAKILYGNDTLREEITQNSKLRTQN